MTTDISKLPSSDIWVSETVRFTVFLPSEEKPAGVSSWWTRLTGHEERSINSNRSLHLDSGILSLDDTEKRVLQVSWIPGRLDIRLVPDQEKGSSPTELLHVGELKSCLEKLSTVVGKWITFSECPRSNRVALGVTLLHSVSSKEEGYSILSPFIKNYVTLDPDSSDFRYSINRPQNSTSIPGVVINRLSQWFVWLWQRKSLQFDLGANSVREEIIGPAQFAVRADLDINTAPIEGLVFSGSDYMPLFNEFAKLVLAVAEKGDYK